MCTQASVFKTQLKDRRVTRNMEWLIELQVPTELSRHQYIGRGLGKKIKVEKKGGKRQSHEKSMSRILKKYARK